VRRRGTCRGARRHSAARFGRASGRAPTGDPGTGLLPLHARRRRDYGGLLADGKPAYPIAVVRAARQEADFWLSKPHMDTAPKDRKEGYEAAMNMLNPYIAAGKFKPFDGDIELVPGIRARAAHGHTAGHTVYVVESKGQKLVLWGDLMHVASIQFPDPTVTISFDTDSDMAAAQRKRVFADAAEQGLWVGGAHLSFPGIGHLRAMGAGVSIRAGELQRAALTARCQTGGSSVAALLIWSAFFFVALPATAADKPQEVTIPEGSHQLHGCFWAPAGPGSRSRRGWMRNTLR
jgi:glyoxylase-like metal-dependent hydrolase (beta-lactamase superfamily II)